MKKTFGEWLLNYEGKDPTIKDLSEDYKIDYDLNFVPENKTHIKTADLMMWHISSRLGCTEAMDACKKAAKLYGETLVDWD